MDWQVQLSELTAGCLVRIGPDLAGGSETGGSGVWIAPGVIVTCAHVVPSGRESAVQVGWGDRVLRGTVTDQIPPDQGDGGLWAFPDLAVVAVDDPPEHPCAWLSEAVPHDGAQLKAFGHSGALHEGLRPAAVEGRLGGWHAFGDGRKWQFKGNELAQGMSGGPVLDVRTGAVCAVVADGELEDSGGYLVPLAALRELPGDRWLAILHEHDRFHAHDQRWASLRSQRDERDAVPGLLSPLEEVKLFGLLAELPAPGTEALERLYAACCGDNRSLATPPAALRDVALAFMDVPGADADRAMPLLRMAHELSRRHARFGYGEKLGHWASAFAGRLGRDSVLERWRSESAAAGASRSGVVSVQIVPGYATVDRYRLIVTVHDGSRASFRLYCDEEPRHTLAEAKQAACECLREALCWLRGDALIEFVVPQELFDEPFDELPVTRRSYTNVGRKYPVVLRDHDRWIDDSLFRDWRQRWERLRDQGGDVRWIVCTEDLTQEEFSAELEQCPETTVLALTRRPNSTASIGEMLRVGLDSGVPIAVWRRDTCPEHDAGSPDQACSGQRFRDAISDVLSTTAAHELPERVRLLRNEVVNRQADKGDHRGVVLLWDDPERSPQMLAPVREPGQYKFEKV